MPHLGRAPVITAPRREAVVAHLGWADGRLILVVVARVAVVAHGGIAPRVGVLAPVQGANNARSLAGEVGHAIFPDLDVHVEGVADDDVGIGAADGEHAAYPAKGGRGGASWSGQKEQ